MKSAPVFMQKIGALYVASAVPSHAFAFVAIKPDFKFSCALYALVAASARYQTPKLPKVA